MTGTGPGLVAAVVETDALPLLLCFATAPEGSGFFPKAAALEPDDDELDEDVLEEVEVEAFLRFEFSFSGSTEAALTGFIAAELSERVLLPVRSFEVAWATTLVFLLVATALPCSVRSFWDEDDLALTFAALLGLVVGLCRVRVVGCA